ncbi:hypothetical protein AB5J62_05355 [Amycolatopsis sp. cg5]|uniref:hypothetical protein n=1 Tax=Amycolatopsis sp. cg5 TaxID=3238802 RepID=UPI003524C132
MGDFFEGAGEVITDGVKSAVDWAGDLFSGDVGTQPMAVPEFVDKMKAGSSAPWHEAAANAAKTGTSQGEHATSLQAIITGLESSWTGAGADAARARINKLRTVADSANQAMTHNQQMVLTAASGFESTQGTLVKMPPRPDKSFGDVIWPWDTDTEKAIEDYNKKAKFNLDVYHRYEQQMQQSQGGLQGDYGQLGFYDGADMTLAPPPPGHEPKPPGGHGRSDGSGGHINDAGFTPSPTPGPAGGQPGAPGGTSGVVAPDHTTTAGFTPTPPPTGQPAPVIPPPGTGSGPGGVEPWLGMGGPLATGSGGGSSARFGAGEPGSLKGGAGTGSGAPGGGARSGAGAMGAAAEAERLAGRAGSRLTGAGAPGGMAPGARGKGEEDSEHARKYGLEEVPFTTEDIDPETGYPVVPPTIGS